MSALDVSGPLRKIRFTEAQVIGVLRGLEAGAKIAEVCRRRGVTETTIHRWRRSYGGLQVSEARRLKPLGDENRQRKRIVADQPLNLQEVKDLLGKQYWRTHSGGRPSPSP